MKMRPPVKPMATTISLVQKGHSRTPEDPRLLCRFLRPPVSSTRGWFSLPSSDPNDCSSISALSSPTLPLCTPSVSRLLPLRRRALRAFSLLQLRASRPTSSSEEESDCGAPEQRRRAGTHPSQEKHKTSVTYCQADEQATLGRYSHSISSSPRLPVLRSSLLCVICCPINRLFSGKGDNTLELLSSISPIRIIKRSRDGTGSGHRGNRKTALEMMELPFTGFELTFIIVAFTIFFLFSLASVCIQPDRAQP
ncbi:hypothetical protein INR49_016935, partial [Caranx melampygus]